MKLIICIMALAAMALGGEDELIKEANDKFTAKMFHEVSTDAANAGKSVILSPYSVLSPLAQLALASVGDSHDELLRAIGLPNDDMTKTVFKEVNQQIRAVKGVELNIASRVYIAADAELNTEFATLSKEVFNSDVKNVDFSKKESVDEINAWVEDSTNRKIKNLLSESSVDATTRAVLVNAIYFKGQWKEKFNVKKTTDRDFHVSKSKTIQVPTMQITKEFLYGESPELNAKLLELPYEGGDSSLVIVLPNEVEGIAGLQEQLKDPALLNKAIEGMANKEVDVSLPKFKIETEIDLKKILQKMDVNKLFDSSQAKLDNLLKKNSDLYISGAVQKAFIEVNEDGAEAAAANAVVIISKSGFVPDNVVLEVNHPFYYHIKFGSLIVFNGVYYQ